MPLGSTLARERTVALLGNPNTGKSTLFVALSGVRQHVANYPGATVEKKLGHMRHRGSRWLLVDLPGTYSLAPRSIDELVAVDVLLGRRGEVPPPDVVLCVLDASNLPRNLYLLSQVLELGRPTVVALTMLDVARARGLDVDVEKLGERLGVPVVPVNAPRRQGIAALREAIARAAEAPARSFESPLPEPIREEVSTLERALAGTAGHGREATAAALPRYLVERLLLDRGGILESSLLAGHESDSRSALAASRDRLERAGWHAATAETQARHAWSGAVLEGVLDRPERPRETRGDRIDAVLAHPVLGSVVLAAVLLVMFQAVFKWAEAPMTAIEDAVGSAGAWVEGAMPPGALRSLLVDGVIGGVGAVVVFVPQIAILFFFLAILEDCGYLARAAYLTDRHMVRVGLSGKSFIPLLSSFACAIPGVMAARTIEDRRDRLTTILVAPLMSCSARLPVYGLLIGAFIPARRVLGSWLDLRGLVFFGLYALGVVVAAVVARVLKRTVFRGAASPFVMELPSYKWPSPRVVVSRVVERSWVFLKGAGTLILSVSILMWAALYYPRLDPAVRAPLETRLAALEDEAARAEVAGDAAAAERARAAAEDVGAQLVSAQQRQSHLGRAGHAIEPAVRPLGWDWRIGSAAIASFPAREVVVASLGVIFGVSGDVEEDEGIGRLRDSLREATWADSGRPLFTTASALSLLVFFALCAQCVSTLAVIGRETNSWRWPAFCFAYMTTLAYLGAMLAYQVASRLGGA